MPYIKPEDKKAVDEHIDAIPVTVEGTITYAITRLVHRYLQQRPLKYVHLNAAAGMFFTAAMELYRKVIAPYEDQKIAENGTATSLDESLNPDQGAVVIHADICKCRQCIANRQESAEEKDM